VCRLQSWTAPGRRIDADSALIVELDGQAVASVRSLSVHERTDRLTTCGHVCVFAASPRGQTARRPPVVLSVCPNGTWCRRVDCMSKFYPEYPEFWIGSHALLCLLLIAILSLTFRCSFKIAANDFFCENRPLLSAWQCLSLDWGSYPGSPLFAPVIKFWAAYCTAPRWNESVPKIIINDTKIFFP